jgi:hypothetical protein
MWTRTGTFFCPFATGSNVIRTAIFFCPSGMGEYVDTDRNFLLSLRDGVDSIRSSFVSGVFQRWLIARYGLHHALGDDEA